MFMMFYHVHCFTSAGETVVREYTPVVNILDSNRVQNKHLILMVKIYPDGKMTQYLSGIQTG